MQQTPPPGELTWADQYGTIAADVYELAQRLWPRLESFARQTLGDPHLGQQLLMKACAAVTRVRTNEPGRITHLGAYLEATWKHLVVAESEQKQTRQQRHLEATDHARRTAPDAVQQIEHEILLRELTARMDAWTRAVFEYRVLGYTFEELSPTFGSNGHVIRTKFGKKLKKLLQHIQPAHRP